jgi:phage tail-like protein
LPKQVRYSNLVLKRGAVALGSVLNVWLTATLNSGLALPIVTQDLIVMLLDRNGLPLITWTVVGAFPVRWELAPLSSEDNKVLIETLELSYNYFFRLPV